MGRKAADFLNMSATLLEMGINPVFCNEVMISNSNQTDCLMLVFMSK